MKAQAPFSESTLTELFDRYTEAPDAMGKLDVLGSFFIMIAMTLYPALSKKMAMKQLGAQSKDLSLCYGYLLAIEKAKIIGLISKEKSFSFHSLDAIYILRSISELVSNAGQLEIPYELSCITDSLNNKFNLSISKMRLDGLIADYMISKQNKEAKKIRRNTSILIALTVVNVVMIAVHFYL